SRRSSPSRASARLTRRPEGSRNRIAKDTPPAGRPPASLPGFFAHRSRVLVTRGRSAGRARPWRVFWPMVSVGEAGRARHRRKWVSDEAVSQGKGSRLGVLGRGVEGVHDVVRVVVDAAVVGVAPPLCLVGVA